MHFMRLLSLSRCLTKSFMPLVTYLDQPGTHSSSLPRAATGTYTHTTTQHTNKHTHTHKYTLTHKTLTPLQIPNTGCKYTQSTTHSKHSTQTHTQTRNDKFLTQYTKSHTHTRTRTHTRTHTHSHQCCCEAPVRKLQ